MTVHVQLPRTLSLSTAEPPLPLLEKTGAEVVLGSRRNSGLIAEPITATPESLFAPRAVALASRRGPLIVSDTGHHRVLVWNRIPTFDSQPADLVIGQGDCFSEKPNAAQNPGAGTLNVPTGVATGNGFLAIADAWNHRVLLWRGIPKAPHQPADIVVGQTDFQSAEPNRGFGCPGPDTLYWCYGVAIHGNRLLVADTGNRRVLVWNQIPTSNGTPADLVLGQTEFTTRDECSRSGGSGGMRWPHGIFEHDGSLFVADAGTSRIMVWKDAPRACGQQCDFVLGQRTFFELDHKGGCSYPSAKTLNMPYGICVSESSLIVADTASSRLVGFELSELSMGVAARSLAGQIRFDEAGENRWQFPSRNSLCWPYGVASSGDIVAIADSGNNRVLLWRRSAP